MPAPIRNDIEQRKPHSKSKIINYDEARRYKNIERNAIGNLELQYLVEIYRKVQEIANSSDRIVPEKIDKRYIVELEKENEKLKRKLEKSLPVHIIIYITSCSVAIGISLTLLVLRFSLGIYIVEPYYIICAFLISLTLLMTAIVAIKDWKDYMTDAKK